MASYRSFFRLLQSCIISIFFFFNDTATTEIYTLSLHDALPICGGLSSPTLYPTLYKAVCAYTIVINRSACLLVLDRKSTRLNSSHGYISYAVFCLKKKNVAPSEG